MNKFISLALLLFAYFQSFGQVKIHSHNDYVRKAPLLEAYNYKADQIEADIFLVDGKLVVAHSKKEIDIAKTLTKVYLSPISNYFKQFNQRVSTDPAYTFSLMIDIKQDWYLTYPILKKEIEAFGDVFNRNKGKKNIQIVISGNRPPDSTYHTYPKWLFFDGLPNVAYANTDLKKITMISDNFATYSKWNGEGEIPEIDKVKLKKIILAAHQLKKPVRFWGAPDTEACWSQLRELGADIINTDKIKESNIFLKQKP